MRVWNAATGRELCALEGHENWVLSACFSQDGKTLASGAADNTVRVWDAATGRELRVLKGHENSAWSVCFSPDGKTLASGSADGTVRLTTLAGFRTERLLGHLPGAWYSAGPGRLPEGDEAGLRAISYASRDFRVWSGWELRLAAEDGRRFAIGGLDDMTFD